MMTKEVGCGDIRLSHQSFLYKSVISLPESASREAMTRKANIKVAFRFMLSANAFVHEISAKEKKKPFIPPWEQTNLAA